MTDKKTKQNVVDLVDSWKEPFVSAGFYDDTEVFVITGPAGSVAIDDVALALLYDYVDAHESEILSDITWERYEWY